MAVTIKDFIEYLESHIGDAYVWGAQGQCISDMADPEEWIRRKETSATNANRAIAFVDKATKRPLYAFDCSGLGMYYIQNLNKITGDMSSNTMYGKCDKLSKSELRKGDWVFRKNTGGKVYHVGYVVNDALDVIESMGRDVGVVKRSLNASGSSYWNAFGRPSFIFEQSTSSAYEPYEVSKIGISKDETIYVRKTPSILTANSNLVVKISNAEGKSFTLLGENGSYYYAQYSGYKGYVRKQDFDVREEASGEPYFAVCSGGSVNVRSGAGTQHHKLGVAHKGDKMLAVQYSDDWCQIAIVLDGEMTIGFMSAKYVEKE